VRGLELLNHWGHVPGVESHQDGVAGGFVKSCAGCESFGHKYNLARLAGEFPEEEEKLPSTRQESLCSV
jgi:hypothetical protein